MIKQNYKDSPLDSFLEFTVNVEKARLLSLDSVEFDLSRDRVEGQKSSLFIGLPLLSLEI